jgi:glycosyltransferase involved in cell wall biosynthesis
LIKSLKLNDIMRKPVLTIFYQFNPWQSSIGGIQTIVCSFLKYASEDFEVRLVGTGEPGCTLGAWQETEFAGKAIKFMPIIALDDDNIRTPIPTTLRYTAALFGRRGLASDFMHFHRLEPTAATLNWSGHKSLFIHNDIKRQMDAAKGNKAILWQRFPFAYFALEGFLLKQFDRIFSCNSESSKFYQQRYPALADRVSYIKNTVDTEIFYPLTPTAKEAQRQQLAQQLGVAEDTRFLLFAGRLHPQKDPLLLIDAFALLVKEEENAKLHLLIAGEGELSEKLRNSINNYGINQKVTMLGAIGQKRLADLHRISSVFVLTSVFEGLPLTILEALACGTPAVSTNCGETPQFLSAQSGAIAEPRTPAAIAAATRQILTNPEAYPPSACTRTAQPYEARTVVTQVYRNMMNVWEERINSHHHHLFHQQ